MAETTWEVYPQTYDALTIVAGSQTFEWLATSVRVDGTAGISKWDVKEAPGTDGARITYKGYTPAKPSISWQLYTNAHEMAFQDLLSAVVPKPGKTPPSRIAVLHPSLMHFGLVNFYVEDISIPKQVQAGIREVTLKLIQYFEQPKVAKTVAKGGSGSTLAGYAAGGKPLKPGEFAYFPGAVPDVEDRTGGSGKLHYPPSATKPQP